MQKNQKDLDRAKEREREKRGAFPKEKDLSIIFENVLKPNLNLKVLFHSKKRRFLKLTVFFFSSNLEQEKKERERKKREKRKKKKTTSSDKGEKRSLFLFSLLSPLSSLSRPFTFKGRRPPQRGSHTLTSLFSLSLLCFT